MLMCSIFYSVIKPVCLPLQLCPAWKDRAFVGRAVQLIMWVAPKLLLVLTLVLNNLVDQIFELSISNKEQLRHNGNFTLYSFNILSGALWAKDIYSTIWHLLVLLTNLDAHWCVPGFIASQPAWLCWALLCAADPTIIHLGWGLDSWHAIGCRIPFRYLTALRQPLRMTSLVLPMIEMLPNIMTLPLLKAVRCNNQHSILHIISTLGPCLPLSPDETFTYQLNKKFSYMFQFHCQCCRHQCKWAWRGMAVIAGFSAVSWVWRLAKWSVPDRLIRDLYATLPANLCTTAYSSSVLEESWTCLLGVLSCWDAHFVVYLWHHQFYWTRPSGGDGTTADSNKGCNLVLWNTNFNFPHHTGLFRSRQTMLGAPWDTKRSIKLGAAPSRPHAHRRYSNQNSKQEPTF